MQAFDGDKVLLHQRERHEVGEEGHAANVWEVV